MLFLFISYSARVDALIRNLSTNKYLHVLINKCRAVYIKEAETSAVACNQIGQLVTCASIA